MVTNIKLPSQVVCWTHTGKPGNLRSQNEYDPNHPDGYSLHCATNNQYLTYGKVPLGINLAWANDGKDKKLHLELPDKKVRDILTGEAFALGIGGGEAFLKYGERKSGINLNWSKSPIFEWRMFTVGEAAGKPIGAGTKFAILNDSVEPDADFLVFFNRTVPGETDIGWTSSPGLLGQIQKAAGFAWDHKSTASALLSGSPVAIALAVANEANG